MLNLAGMILVFLAYLAFAARRLMTYLHILQQDDYDNGRLLRWIVRNKVFDRRLSIALLVTGLLWFFFRWELISFLLTFICFAVIAVL